VSAHERRAESGNAVSQYEMGKCFVKLNEVDHAIVWLERASKSGHARAMCRLAALLHQQKRDEANETTAFGLLARAAELGSSEEETSTLLLLTLTCSFSPVEGMFGAANRLLVGLGVEKDEENASALFSFLFDSLVSSTHHHEKRSVLKTILSGLIEYFSSKREVCNKHELVRFI
jgi:TPR repeat protein